MAACGSRRGPYTAAEGAIGLFLVTEWKDYRRPDLRKLKKVMRAPVIFDGRNAFDPAHLKKLGVTYFAVGRPSDGLRPPLAESESAAA